MLPTTRSCDRASPDHSEKHSPPLIRPLNARRLCTQLSHASLGTEQLGRLLRWYAHVRDRPVFGEADDRLAFTEAIRIDVGGEGGGGPSSRRLSEISLHPLGGLQLPPQLPLPPECLPHALAAQLSEGECEAKLGLKKLRFDVWLPFVRAALYALDPPRCRRSPHSLLLAGSLAAACLLLTLVLFGGAMSRPVVLGAGRTRMALAMVPFAGRAWPRHGPFRCRSHTMACGVGR